MDDEVLARSLEELENDRWPRATYDSYLVQTAHRLRSVPVGDLTVEDLRLLLGQKIGTRWLMPIALDRLRVEPMAMGDFYPGDLLSSVLATESSYWTSHPDQLMAPYEVRSSLEKEREDRDRMLSDAQWPEFG
jgi:CDI immunity proteins